jgi:excisionase family DNA binding protein
MRYRVRISRVQVAERSMRAADEESAIALVHQELEKPYGLLGRWETVSTDVEVVAAEQSVGRTPIAPTEGALLLSVAEAAKTLGISRGSLYELVNGGEIRSLQIGRRRLVPREALVEFIDRNTRAGRHNPR